jgi:hypothetical protein
MESLHHDIKALLTGSSGTSEFGVNVTRVETITRTDNKPKAVIDRLSVGTKSTTWARFLERPLKGFVRFERAEIGWLPLYVKPVFISHIGFLT